MHGQWYMFYFDLSPTTNLMLNKELLQYTGDGEQVTSLTLTVTPRFSPRLSLVPCPIRDQIAVVLVEQPTNVRSTTSR